LQPVVCGDGGHANSSGSFKYMVFELKVEHNSHKSYASCHQKMKAPAHSSSCDLLIHVIYGSLLVVLVQGCMWIDVSLDSALGHNFQCIPEHSCMASTRQEGREQV
jgi:hypothetical protein